MGAESMSDKDVEMGYEEERRQFTGRRDTDALLHSLLEGQGNLAQVVTEQHEAQAKQFEAMIAKHEEEHHKPYTPDHHEQHKRFGAWLRRIDGAWDGVFKALGLFLLAAIGYGMLVIINAKVALL